MKKIVILFGTLFFCALSLSAQKAELEDSVAVSLYKINTVYLGSPFNVMAESYGLNNDQKLALEYVAYEMARDSWDPVLASVPETDLRLLNEALTYVYNNVLSTAFVSVLDDLMEEAVAFESGQSQYFTYTLNDLVYGSLVDRFFNAVRDRDRYRADLLAMERELVDNAMTAGASIEQQEFFQSFAKRITAHLMDIYKLAFIETVSQETFEHAISLVESPFIKKHLLALEKASASIEALSDDELLSRVNAAVDNVDKDDFISYVTISRSYPYRFVERYRPHVDDLLIGKDVYYSGQTRDGKPDGKGVMRDKKGVTYSGDFKNGLRHGLIEVNDPDKGRISQVWIEDKFRKGLAVGPDADGHVGEPTEYLGHRYGYGSSFDHMSKNLIEGFFIDGKLEGEGLMSSPDYNMEGTFSNGDFVEGVIVWKSPQWKVNTFTGKVNGNVRGGVMVRKMADGSYSDDQEGVFVDGALDGLGRQTVVSFGDTTSRTGLFALGEMYGEGVIKSYSEPDSHGIRETSVYEGGLMKTAAYGQGKLLINMYNLPDGNWRFVKYGIVISDVRGNSDVEINMDGEFNDGQFIKGVVSTSGGLRMEGVFERGVLKEGKIRKVYADGAVYEGDCLNGQYTGQGKLVYADGTIFEGTFEKGVPKEGDYTYPKPAVPEPVEVTETEAEAKTEAEGTEAEKKTETKKEENLNQSFSLTEVS